MKQGFLKNIVAGLFIAGCVSVGMTGCVTQNAGDLHEPDEASKQQETATGTDTAQGYSTETRYSISETASVYDIGGKSVESGSHEASLGVVEDGSYTSMAEVSEYIHEYGHLPDNYITKNEAKKLGWVASKGNLSIVAPGKSIGGDTFGNREGKLPKKKGRRYYECDIDYTGGERNGKRIIYSDDGLIYYTEDHYDSFEQIY